MTTSASAVAQDQCVCEIGLVDGMTSPCSVCPQASMVHLADEYPENCPLAKNHVDLEKIHLWIQD